MSGRRFVRRVLALTLVGALSGVAVGGALAQERGRRAEAEAPRSGAGGNADAQGDVNAEVREDQGEKVKVFRFSGFDISGRLKTPQLLYFLNRLRAEFDRPRLPHRTFVPELERSTKGRAF